MVSVTNILLLLVFTSMLAVGQLLFKHVGLSIQGQPLVDGLLMSARQPMLYVALVIYGLSTALWIWILSRVPLAVAYPWVAVGVAIVPILGWWLFDERLNVTFWMGVCFILVGIVITQYASIAR
jgi:multidrug transporter EmrE-like cation transporter